MVAYTLLEFRQSLAGSLPSDSSSRCTLPAVATKGAPTPQHKRRASGAVFRWLPSSALSAGAGEPRQTFSNRSESVCYTYLCHSHVKV